MLKSTSRVVSDEGGNSITHRCPSLNSRALAVMYTITKQDATEKGDIEQQEVALIQIYLQEEEMKKSL